jgi:hypothetical protein
VREAGIVEAGTSGGAADRPIGDLPAYVQDDAPSTVQHAYEKPQDYVLLVTAVAGLAGATVGLVLSPASAGTWVAAVLMVAVLLPVSLAWLARHERVRFPIAERPGVTVFHPLDEVAFARFVLTSPRVLLRIAVLSVAAALVGLRDPVFSVVVASGFLVAIAVIAIHLVRLEREERRTGRLRMLSRRGRRWRPSLSYGGDGLVIPGPGWRVTLAAPLAQLDIAALDPDSRWCVLSAQGRHEAALAAITKGYTSAEPSRALGAALSLLWLDRLDEAEGWLQRAVDHGYREKSLVLWADAFAPLHLTDAWKALRRQTR